MATSSSACSRRASWSARNAAVASKAATGSGKSMASSVEGKSAAGGEVVGPFVGARLGRKRSSGGAGGGAAGAPRRG